MPLNRNRRLLEKMDVKVYVLTPTTTKSSVTGGPKVGLTENGPYWASMEYLSRKQMEIEVSTRITSIQQIRFRFRYTADLWGEINKAGSLKITDPGEQIFNIISVSKDTGRFQFIELIAELKE